MCFFLRVEKKKWKKGARGREWRSWPDILALLETRVFNLFSSAQSVLYGFPMIALQNFVIHTQFKLRHIEVWTTHAQGK